MRAVPERELKLTIPHRAHYLHLRDDPVWGRRGPVIVQTNHYFDSAAGRLLEGRVLLRLRRERQETGAGVTHAVTLKLGVEVRPGHYDSLEMEWAVEATWFQRALADPAELLATYAEAVEPVRRRLAGEPLLHVGTLENERVVRVVDGLQLEVDRLLLPRGPEVHELEVETEDLGAAEAWLRERAALHGIVLEPARRTKMELLMESLRR